jgi:glutamine amidotransferase
MCRWIAYAGEPVAIETYLFGGPYSLINQSLNARKSIARVNGDGFGLGWYGSRTTPGLFRDILPAWSNENLRSLAQQIDAGMFLAHVRSATGTPTIRPNCHPFAYHHLLFMHNGQIGDYPKVRKQLEGLIPDELYGHRQGSTDSELLFLLLIAYGIEHDFAGAVAEVIDLVETAMYRRAIIEPLRFSIAFATGRQLYALRYASDDAPPTVFYRCVRGGCLLVSEPLDDELEQWSALANGQYLRLDEQHHIETGYFNERAPAAKYDIS